MHKIFRFKERDKNNRFIEDGYGDWKYKEITERAKAFGDWKKFTDKIRIRLKDREENPAEADRFLERIEDERKYENPELLAFT